MELQLAHNTLWIHFDVKNHIDLLAELGLEVTALRERFRALDASVAKDQRPRSVAWRQLESDVLATDPAPSPDEPCILEEILEVRPAARLDRYRPLPNDATVADKVAGGWRGRVAGCILGKPVEPFLREQGSRANLHRALVAAGEYPLTDFTTIECVRPWWQHLIATNNRWFDPEKDLGMSRGHIVAAVADDDLQLTLTSLRLVQRFGDDFGPDDWHDHYRHTMGQGAASLHHNTVLRNRALGLPYPQAARFMNTAREWIDPQIRADLFGYIAPGRPALAARLAFQSAAATATENGLYGAMWVAATLAAAFVEADAEAAMLRGLEQLPTHCRLAEHIRLTITAARRNGDEFEATFDDIEARLGHYFCIHTINNACLVAAGLMHGGSDFGRVIGIAVMGGLDTDCNGATAGSIAGVLLGENAIPARWTEPFQDTFQSGIPGEGDVRISDLIRDTLAAREKVAGREA